jgi:6-phosphogluconolactonase (cycloisomerase 2 family)
MPGVEIPIAVAAMSKNHPVTRIRRILDLEGTSMKTPRSLMGVVGTLLAAPLLTLSARAAYSAEDETPTDDFGRLRHVQSLTRDDLRRVVTASVSCDGKHLYSAAYPVAAVSVFDRDGKTGRLEHKQTFASEDLLLGALCLRVTADGRYAVATAFASRTAVLFQRDPASGRLQLLDVARDGVDGVTGLRWPVDAVISSDSKFVYVIDDARKGRLGRASDGPNGAVTVFRITEEDKLCWVEADYGENGCFNGARGIALHPDGKSMYVTSSGAGTLVMLSRDAISGKTTVKQIIKDEEGGVHGLAGAFAVALSPEGNFVYTSAGCFHGDNAVGVYRRSEDGTLALVQEIVDGTDALRDFTGGNEIVVSPDGHNVYAAGSRSSTVACFRRDPMTGKLTYLETLTGTGPVLLGRPSGVGISPDGDFLYVAAEHSHALSVFKRTRTEE